MRRRSEMDRSRKSCRNVMCSCSFRIHKIWFICVFLFDVSSCKNCATWNRQMASQRPKDRQRKRELNIVKMPRIEVNRAKKFNIKNCLGSYFDSILLHSHHRTHFTWMEAIWRSCFSFISHQFLNDNLADNFHFVLHSNNDSNSRKFKKQRRNRFVLLFYN